jgi:hypothetical protein
MTIIPQLEHDLSVAAERRREVSSDAAPGARRRGRRFAARVAIALSALVVVAVAVAVLSLHHRPANHMERPAAQTVSSTRRELIRVLGILRTPQTPAARNPRGDGPDSMFQGMVGFLARLRSRLRDPNLTAHTRSSLRAEVANVQRAAARSGYVRLDSSLVRVVRAPYDETVGFYPVSEQPSPRAPRRVEELGVSLRVPGSLAAGISAQPVSALLAHGLDPFTYARHANVGVIVVPDGVAKVTLGAIHLALGDLVSPTPLAIPATTATVHDNIAAFRLPVPSVSPWPSVPAGRSGMSSSGAYVRETWLGPEGRVIKHLTVLIAFNFIIRP